MSTLTQSQLNELKAINLFIVGWGTEANKSNPYALVNIYQRFQVNVNGDLANSGYSIGVMNFDFGQRGSNKGNNRGQTTI